MMNSLFTLPNILSLLRLPLAALFAFEEPDTRMVAIVLAMGSDILDGYYARSQGQTSKIGTILDPVTDKIFVFTALTVFFYEGRFLNWELLAFLCRDLSIVFFALYLLLLGRLSSHRPKAFVCGKMTTALQFLLLIALSQGLLIPTSFYFLMALIGSLSFFELLWRQQRQLKGTEKDLYQPLVDIPHLKNAKIPTVDRS